MAKGYQANKERKEAIAAFGKDLGKRAGFKCEWCECAGSGGRCGKGSVPVQGALGSRRDRRKFYR